MWRRLKPQAGNLRLWQGGLLLALGLLAGLGHWFVIAAYALAPASLLTPFTYAQMIWAVAFGYLIFGFIAYRFNGDAKAAGAVAAKA